MHKGDSTSVRCSRLPSVIGCSREFPWAEGMTERPRHKAGSTGRGDLAGLSWSEVRAGGCSENFAAKLWHPFAERAGSEIFQRISILQN